MNIVIVETKFIAGLYLWRDYANALGGICIGGSTFTDSNCEGGERYFSNLILNRRSVSIIAWNLVSDKSFENNLNIWFQDIISREMDLRPHIIITPFEFKYSTICNHCFYHS